MDPRARAQHALDVAYRHLSRRDRTVAELRRYLEHRRVDPDTIATTLAELCERGYLDDARYARTFAEDRRNLDGWGAERIRRRLEQSGVAGAAIEAALEVQGRDEELRAALNVLQTRLATPPDDDRGRERALGMLVRRGYELDLAYDAVRAFERGG